MFQSRKVKIALAVFLVVVLGLAAYFYFRDSSTSQEDKEPKRTVSDDEMVGTGPLPGPGSTQMPPYGGTITSSPTPTLPDQTPTVSVTPIATATITPYPGSGLFDWTRERTIEIKNIDPPSLTTKQIEQIQNNDLCGFANISDNWSDPFEKVLCNFIEFTVFNVIEPLEKLICDLTVVGLNLNYDQNIKSKYENGQCLIEDR